MRMRAQHAAATSMSETPASQKKADALQHLGFPRVWPTQLGQPMHYGASRAHMREAQVSNTDAAGKSVQPAQQAPLPKQSKAGYWGAAEYTQP